jgi:hypothetical protein
MSYNMDVFCLQISDEDEREVLLDSPSMTTVVKNLIPLSRTYYSENEWDCTAIGPELYKTNNPTPYYTA